MSHYVLFYWRTNSCHVMYTNSKKGGWLKRSRNHVTSKKLFFLNKNFRHIYSTSLNTYIKCILACSASLLRAQSGGLEYSFRVIWLLFIFGYDRQSFVHSYVKSKAIFKIHFFPLSKLVKRIKIHLFCNFEVYINFYL